MFRKNKGEWHDGERYPGGRNHLLLGTPAPSLKKEPKATKKNKAMRPARLPINFRQVNWRLDRHHVERLFLIAIFIVIEIMIYRVFFGVFESIFDRLNLPEMTRSVIKLAQLAMSIIFTYGNVMLCFFKVNIFQ